MAEETVLCKVCKLGKIVRSIEHHQEPISRSLWDIVCLRDEKFERWTKPIIHCNTCGVKYEFVPKENLEQPKPLQVTPWLFVAKSSTSIFSKNPGEAKEAKE